MSERRLAAWIVFAISLAALAAIGLVVESHLWSRSLWLARGTGWAAAGALMLSLSATPIGRLLARLGLRILKPITALRRAFGIAAAGFALLHAATVLGGYLRDAWAALWFFSYLRAGVLALAVMSAMLATSFPWLLRVRLWKPLHRLSYVAALLVLDHLLLSPFAPRALTLELFGALCALGLLRFLPYGP